MTLNAGQFPHGWRRDLKVQKCGSTDGCWKHHGIPFRRQWKQEGHILNIRKRQMKFLGHIMRKVGLENLIILWQIEGKWARGKQRITYPVSLSKWMTDHGLRLITKRQNLLRATYINENMVNTILWYIIPRLLHLLTKYSKGCRRVNWKSEASYSYVPYLPTREQVWRLYRRWLIF